MLKSYLVSALRVFARNKRFSLTNIFGLTVGLATCLLILLYILDENSYDKHHKDGNRIYRVASMSAKEGENDDQGWAAAAGPVAAGIRNDLPETEQVTRLMTAPDFSSMVLKYGEGTAHKQFLETNGYYVDSTFFQLFTYEFIYGDPLTALDQPNTMVISDVLARKFFANEDPLHKTIVVTTPLGDANYTVSGVFNKNRYKSHIPANFFLSMRNGDMGKWAEQQTSWAFNNIFFTYVKIKEGIDPKAYDKKVKKLFEQRAANELKGTGISKKLFLQPMQDIYLHSSIGDEIAPNGNITYLYILGSIAVFILLIACINFMNLSTARSEKRAREVGVRKVVGAGRGALILQFLGESMILSLAALLLSFMLLSFLLPAFNQLTQKNIQFGDTWHILGWAFALTAFTGLLAGLYPAFYLSAFRPASVLKGKIRNDLSSTMIRKGLVVFQFTISICLVLAAIVIWQQEELFRNQQLGFNKNRQIILPLQLGFNNSESNYSRLRDELLKDPQIKSVTSASTYPGIPNLSDMLFYAEGKTVNDVVDVQLAAIDHNFFQTLGMKLLNGRNLSEAPKADSDGIILNQTAVRQLGYTAENAIGRQILSSFRGSRFSMHIVGVVADFNFESLHNAIKPFGFTKSMFANKYSYAIANFVTTDYAALLSRMEQAWKKTIPGSPFLYSFLDQDFQRNYEKERQTSRIVDNFTVIAILIACLGLLGLAAYSAEQRTREIGIRKVLGASVTSITRMLSREFILLVCLAILIAMPLSWYCMHKWLQNFAYRIRISWWMFAASGAIAILIALATVSYQSVRAAMANPVKSLRSE